MSRQNCPRASREEAPDCDIRLDKKDSVERDRGNIFVASKALIVFPLLRQNFTISPQTKPQSVRLANGQTIIVRNLGRSRWFSLRYSNEQQNRKETEEQKPHLSSSLSLSFIVSLLPLVCNLQTSNACQ